MPHLIEPIRSVGSAHVSPTECRDRLVECHRYLSENGRAAIFHAGDVQDLEYWGARVKRVPVKLPSENRPADIGKGILEHSLPEVINQCANVERSIDVLDWLGDPANPLGDGYVKVCHPTSSGGSQKKPECDLELVLNDGTAVRFEVTDVAGSQDGNEKELNSLISLGFLAKGALKRTAPKSLRYPDGRNFIAVSESLAQVMTDRGRWWRNPPGDHVDYDPPVRVGGTSIFEVHANE